MASKKIQLVGALNIPQSDWGQTDETQLDYIKNKPEIPSINGLATEDYVDTQNEAKFDKTGGTITGSLTITGNLTVDGTTYTEDHETIRVEDNLLVLNSSKEDVSTSLSGIAINKNADSTYGITYDPTDDTVKLGEGSVDANGDFVFKDGEGKPLTTREDSTKLTDGNLLSWDAKENKLVDSGRAAADIDQKLDRQSEPNRIYSSNTDGETEMLSHDADDFGQVPLRNEHSDILVPLTPSSKDAATSKQYVDDTVASVSSPKILTIDGTVIDMALSCNVEYRCASPVETLTIKSLDSGIDGISEQWSIIFATGDTVAVAYPETVIWAIAEPVFEANKIYWLSFIPLGAKHLGVWTVAEGTEVTASES